MKARVIKEIKEGFQEIKNILLRREYSRTVFKGVTPFNVVYNYNGSKLLHYPGFFPHNQKDNFNATVVLVPPFMVQPFIYDMKPHRSLVRTFLYYNIEPYIVELGISPAQLTGFKLKDYIYDIIPVMIDKVKERTDSRRALFLMGYCMGGILLLIYQSLFPDRDIKGIITVATPIDFSKLGLLYLLGWLLHNQVSDFVDMAGMVPSVLASAGFKLLSSYRLLTRTLNVVLDPEDFKAIAGYELTNEWLDSMIPYPGETFKEFFYELFLYNKLSEKNLYINGRYVDLKRVDIPVFSVAGESDNIAPVKSIEKIMDLISDKAEKEVVIAPGGHISVLIGDQAKEKVWQKIVDWIILQSGK